MTSSAYVFVEGLEDEPVICGEFRLQSESGIGKFRYGRSYLARKNAFPLDPIHLPLGEDIFTTSLNKGIFGVLADAGADAWGRKLITQLHSTKPKNELEFLIAGASMGVGALSFSLSRHKAKAKQSRNTIGDIDLLISGKNAILNAQNVNDEVRRAFEFGISMGGARPKTVLQHHNEEYLVKLNRPDDLFNVSRVEHATMTMLRELTPNVAKTQLLEGAEDLLMVKRFDRTFNGSESGVSHHFITANSLLVEGKVTEMSGRHWYSYPAFAEYLRRFSARGSDAHELFLRMVFNILIGNTDDHGRNHAMLYDLSSQEWTLSPAYDVLPINNSRQHSLGIGERGREGTLENAMSQCKRFGLSNAKAKHIVNEVKEVAREWRHFMTNAGVGEGDIERLAAVLP
ncbi:type II toxin-antitoxin system HipA family toxin [Aliidiomarina celeris]|uniref:type II toxin-antitoxin system HipA family toxin n=1 Tax=Aliidiomarina celeris TaxID=2249428 RepID=UPI000DEB30F4|nr:type II toxin-antitoxin system HipA family toxin [Aliidiomarina celeris]